MHNITFGKFQLDNYAHCPIVTDANVAKLYNITGSNVYLLPQGEQAKSFKHVEALCSWLLARNHSVSDTIVAVGGGSVGDTVGFVASIYKRGTRLLHVPTTLIAQIDSSIGGKTALDLNGIKNAVGTYYLGDTLIDVDFLRTLDSEQLLSGQGEILKYRMLCQDVDSAYSNGNGLVEVIEKCVQYKRSICEKDLLCNGVRNKLNFGHTIGHAMELSYGISHGVAVANGIYYETMVAAKTNVCTQQYADKWMREVASKFHIYPLSEQLLSLTLNDKKNTDSNSICLVLPTDFTEAYFTLDQLKELLLK